MRTTREIGETARARGAVLPGRLRSAVLLPLAGFLLAGCSAAHRRPVAPAPKGGGPLVGGFGPLPGSVAQPKPTSGTGVVPASSSQAAMPPLPVSSASVSNAELASGTPLPGGRDLR